ncbi:MAG: hypothetical protein N5P05_001756 [Chroococcopsis gigantea SAG 12.99]|jgi:hypothetical protein|nr:hypothetical protein [Chroococcopsis gigantea SAG 12.99]
MSGTIRPETEAILNKLRYFQLTEFLMNPDDFSSRLTFRFNPDSQDIIVELLDIVHIILSKDPDDNDGCYPVGEVTLTNLKDGGKEVLESVNYPFKNRQGDVFSYPAKELFHFYLEGCIRLQVVCGRYRIFQTH